MDSFQKVIDKWSSPVELASDIGENHHTVRKWHFRDRIPGEKWAAIVAASKKRRYGITLGLLASLKAGVNSRERSKAA